MNVPLSSQTDSLTLKQEILILDSFYKYNRRFLMRGFNSRSYIEVLNFWLERESVGSYTRRALRLSLMSYEDKEIIRKKVCEPNPK